MGDTCGVTDVRTTPQPLVASVPDQSLAALFRRFLGFGLLAWGGPVAQIAMLRRELVDRERWISSERFNRTLAVYQVLPGPEAHELCVYFGYLARGRIGGLIAGLGFMLPGLTLMLALSWFYLNVGTDSSLVLAFFAGAQAAVLALIVRAVHRIGAHALTDRWLATIALLAAIAALVGVHFALVLLMAGVSYFLVSRRLVAVALAVLMVGAGLTTMVALTGSQPVPIAAIESEGAEPAGTGSEAPIPLFASGLKAGLLTFGGAYTAIPFLEADAIEADWMTSRTFLDGVALSGVLPAPLIIFATFVGFVAGGLIGALAITAGVFGPAFAFTLVGHRQLERLVENRSMHALLDGVTAGVVGLIAATALLLLPVAVRSLSGAAVFGVVLVSLYLWKSGKAVAVVMLGSGIAGVVLQWVSGSAP